MRCQATWNLFVAYASAKRAFVTIGDWGGLSIAPPPDYHAVDQLAVAKAFATTAADVDAQFVLNVGVG